MRTFARAFGPSLALALVALSSRARAQATVLEGQVTPGEPDHQFLAFDVPANAVEIEITHDSLTAGNIIDWGVYDPAGFRGWGGGLTEPTVIGAQAASRGYRAGPLPAGTWQLVLGKAKIETNPANYRATVTVRVAPEAPTLAPQPERQPYVAPAALATGARWWAGDFHVHSRESGDANPTLDEALDFAATRGLDFIELSDHNTNSQLDFYNDAQPRHPDVLLLPGVEYTTYDGHANGVGATAWVDHKIGFRGATIEAAAIAFRDQGAVFSLNHPELDFGSLCIGCAWRHPLDRALVGAYEIGTGSWDQSAQLFTPKVIAEWTAQTAAGANIAPIGGSDDHKGGKGTADDLFYSPIGSPTTLVWADELSVRAIVEGVRKGRTVVKLRGPEDPMVELSTAGEPAAMAGDTVRGVDGATLVVTVTGGASHNVRIYKGGQEVSKVDVTSDPFRFELPVTAPATGRDFYRAEALDGDTPRTVTAHLYVAANGAGASGASGAAGAAGSPGAAGDGNAADPADLEGGCDCGRPLPSNAPGRGATRVLAFASLAALVARARRRRDGLDE